MLPTSLGTINVSIFPSLSWSLAATGVSLAVRTVSQSTWQQYLLRIDLEDLCFARENLKYWNITWQFYNLPRLKQSQHLNFFINFGLGATPGNAERGITPDYTQGSLLAGSEDYIGYQRLNLGWPYVKQASYILAYLSSPQCNFGGRKDNMGIKTWSSYGQSMCSITKPQSSILYLISYFGGKGQVGLHSRMLRAYFLLRAHASRAWNHIPDIESRSVTCKICDLHPLVFFWNLF